MDSNELQMAIGMKVPGRGVPSNAALPPAWLLAVVASMILSCGADSGSNPPQSVNKVEADLKAAKTVVSFQDQDKTFTISRNDLFGVSLDGSWYRVASSNSGVLSFASGPVLTPDGVTIATFRALNVDHAQVTANTKACPNCASAEAVFRVQVQVSADG